jgi:DNA-binding FadR family transcriptional regulator
MSFGIKELNIPLAYRAVSDELQKLIQSGSLAPGQALPSESVLAEQFGVHRSTIREGIRQLENEGYLTRASRKTLRVTIPGREAIGNRSSRALLVHKVTFRQLWEAAMVLEPQSAFLAAQRANEAQIEALRQNVRRTREVIANTNSRRPEDIVKVASDFHSLVCEATGNFAIVLAREPIGQLFYPACLAIEPMLPQSGPRMETAHSKITDAIERRDAVEAETWMRKHIEDFRRGWLLAKRDEDLPVSEAFEA